jgi:hypothetical protein
MALSQIKAHASLQSCVYSLKTSFVDNFENLQELAIRVADQPEQPM